MSTTDEVRIQAGFTKDMQRRIRVLAAHTDVSVPDIMRAAVTEYVEREEAKLKSK